MPRAWVQAIEEASARVTALRDQAAGYATEAAAHAAEARTVRSAVPEPVDPAPLINAALAPILSDSAAATVAADQALRLAQAASERAEEAFLRPIQSPSEQLLTVFHALARVLATRMLLFLSLIGGFALAVMAMAQQSLLSLALMVAFSLLTTGPLAWLEVSSRPRTPVGGTD